MIGSVSLLQQVVSVVSSLSADPLLVAGYFGLLGLSSSSAVLLGRRSTRFRFAFA